MTIEEIKQKVQYGDYTTLGAMLEIPPTTAKMRFIRGDEEAKLALEKIIQNRESMIENFKSEQKQ